MLVYSRHKRDYSSTLSDFSTENDTSSDNDDEMSSDPLEDEGLFVNNVDSIDEEIHFQKYKPRTSSVLILFFIV